jgi:hypothetical protein
MSKVVVPLPKGGIANGPRPGPKSPKKPSCR